MNSYLCADHFLQEREYRKGPTLDMPKMRFYELRNNEGLTLRCVTIATMSNLIIMSPIWRFFEHFQCEKYNYP